MKISPQTNPVRFGAVYVMTSEAEKRLQQASICLDNQEKRENKQYLPRFDAYLAGMTGDNAFLERTDSLLFQEFNHKGFARILVSNTNTPDLDAMRTGYNKLHGLYGDVYTQAVEKLQQEIYEKAKREGRLNIVR